MIKCIYDGNDVFLWLPTEFGKSFCYKTVVCFNYKHSDGGTRDGCTIVVVVSPIVSLIIRLVRKGFPESFAHAQTVNTRPLFPPPMWPGYEASGSPKYIIP